MYSTAHRYTILHSTVQHNTTPWYNRLHNTVWTVLDLPYNSLCVPVFCTYFSESEHSGLIFIDLTVCLAQHVLHPPTQVVLPRQSMQ
jgi:hypothetical protein